MWIFDEDDCTDKNVFIYFLHYCDIVSINKLHITIWSLELKLIYHKNK